MQKAVIIGGGFGGIQAALDLVKNPNLEVVLISKNENFEYYPGLHKIVGTSDCAMYTVPLATIFRGKKVQVVVGEVTDINPSEKVVTLVTPPASRPSATSPLQGEDSAPATEILTADFLVLAVGSQTEYFGIPGLAEMSFGFKSVAEAKKLRAHIQDAFKKHVHSDKSESVMALRFVIVGAGPNGVDVAGELASLGQKLAARYKISPSLMSIDLIDGASRVLPMMSESVSHHVEKRLRDLGVHVMCNRELRELDSWTVEFADEKIGTKTLIWTAGITTNELVKKIPGVTLEKKNRIAVDNFLQAQNFENFFVIGDAADTPHAGLAQTALYDAQFVSEIIVAKIKNKPLKAYIPHAPAFNIGVGPQWSVMMVGNFVLYGLPAYIMRTLIDIKFFLSILPVREVWKLYFPKA